MAEAAAPGKSFTVANDSEGRPCLAYAPASGSLNLYASVDGLPIHVTPGRIAPDDPASFLHRIVGGSTSGR